MYLGLFHTVSQVLVGLLTGKGHESHVIAIEAYHGKQQLVDAVRHATL